MELLADEAEVPPDRIQEYWQIAADLITLASDVAEYAAIHPDAQYDQPEMLALKRRVRDIASRLSQIRYEE